MNNNEIYKSYGTDYKEMTKRLLNKVNLKSEIEKKSITCEKKLSEMRIAIKPNVLGVIPAEFGATTHTEIVEGIIEYLKEIGVLNIVIMEGSWVGDKTKDAFEILGYNSLASRQNVEIIDTQKEKSYKTKCNGIEFNICECEKNQDFLINVPVLKGHCQTKITCSLKNMKGLIPNSEKRRFHTMGLHMPIAYLNQCIHQDFIVVDHICGDPDFEEGGNPLVRNCIMAAKDPVLVDSYTAKILGYKPYDIEYIKMAEKLGIGSSDLDKLQTILVEGKEFEEINDVHKIIETSYMVEDIDSCSACYGMLVAAINRIKEEGLIDKIPEKICIGQGYKNKFGKYGVGNCTKCFENSVEGCPPSEDEIYLKIKSWIMNKK